MTAIRMVVWFSVNNMNITTQDEAKPANETSIVFHPAHTITCSDILRGEHVPLCGMQYRPPTPLYSPRLLLFRSRDRGDCTRTWNALPKNGINEQRRIVKEVQAAPAGAGGTC